MEFQYRAGDDRGRSPPSPTGAAAASANSGSPDDHGGDGAGDHGENWAVVPRPPPPPPAHPDELRRQVAKDKIRERILREEVEHWALEAEVRRELMEQLFPLLRSGPRRSSGARAEGSDAMAAPAGLMTADSPSPIVLEPMQVGSKANASAALPAKRKNPDVTAASAISAATSSKKQKPDLTCTVCGVTATSMKTMQDHLKGKGHRKKAAALAQPMPEAEHEQKQEGVVTPPSGGYTPSKLTMLTNAGAMNEVLQMDGYILCEVCNVRTADRVTMMCHLEGNKHTSKAQKPRQAGKPPAVSAAAAVKKCVKEYSAPAITAAVAGGDPEAAVVVVDGVPRTVRRVDGFLLCECCDVKAPSESVMQSHLAGKKHKNKAKVSLEQAKAKDVASITGAAQMEVASATLQAKAADASVSVALKLADGTAEIGEVTAMAAKAGDHGELQETGELAEEDVAANVDIPTSPGQEVKKFDAPAAAFTDTVNVGGSESVVVGIDGVQHVVQRVDGFLLCACCNVKAPSDCLMRSHLTGKKHKNKTKVSLEQAKAKDVASVTGAAQMEVASATLQAKAADASVSVALKLADGTAEIGEVTAMAAKAGDHGELQETGELAEEDVAANVDIPTSPGQEVKKFDAPAAAFTDTVNVGGSESVVVGVDGVQHVVQRVDGFLLCACCNVKTPSDYLMRSHLTGKKHKNKAKVSLEQAKAKDVTSVTGAARMEVASTTLQAKAADASVSVALKLADGTAEIGEVTAMAAKVGDHGELQETGEMVEEDVATIVDIPTSPGQEVKKFDAPAAAFTDTVNVGGSEWVVVGVDGVQDVVQRVDGFLLCACCNVKAPPSGCILRSHLTGKKHKNKVKVAAVHVGAGGKEAALAEAKSKEASAVASTGHTQGNDSVKGQAAGEAPLATPQGDAACASLSMAPMEVDEPAEVEGVTSIAEGDNAAAEVNSSATQGEESVKTDGVAAPAQEIKIQVEGKVCTVLRQANGALSCERCDVHGRDKNGMLLHLYTRAHWDIVRVDEEKEQVAAAPAVVNEDSDGGASEGTAQVEN